jgi:hypothetical protein
MCRLINYYYRQSLKFKTQVKRKWGKWAKYGRKYRRQWEEEAWAKGR